MNVYIIERTITPGVVHHAELQGPLPRHDQATYAEIEAISDERDPVDEDEAYGIRQLMIDEMSRSMAVRFSHRFPIDLERGRFKPQLPAYRVGDRIWNGEGQHHISETLRATWLSFKRTGSMSATAREFGVSPLTIRDRLISYRIKVARAAGIEMGTVAENRVGRVASVKRGRPTNAERAARAEAINSNMHKEDA